jgi:hypothetical protein
MTKLPLHMADWCSVGPLLEALATFIWIIEKEELVIRDNFQNKILRKNHDNTNKTCNVYEYNENVNYHMGIMKNIEMMVIISNYEICRSSKIITSINDSITIYKKISISLLYHLQLFLLPAPGYL